jgi:ornithine cyclodeaminase/alanine dehydrogenase-like protein (mu-crystallin family)
MGGVLSRRGYLGFKAYTTTRNGARFLVNLYDAQDGRLLSILEADVLGQLRTGAATGVATKYLSSPEAQVMALFGAGFQAETQLEAVSLVRELRAVRVFCRSQERRELFAERMAAKLGLSVVPVNNPGEAVVGADIITTITSAAEPVFSGEDVVAGMHINAAGSNSAIRRELDTTAVRRADRIFVDDLVQARIESGDLIYAQERNTLNWARVRPLADAVAGLTPGRRTPDEITLFESHGIALWDIALAAEVYERATSEGVGTLVELFD